MANTREVPFGQYYGSIDSTPLFVILAGAYFQRTGDIDTLRTLWPHVERAIAWLMEFGDSGLKFELRAWSSTLIQKKGLLISDLNFAILELFTAHGIEIPFPQRELHIRRDSGQGTAQE